MKLFDDELQRRLAGLREQNLFRELRRVDSAQGPHIRINGETLLNFSSNDYLGLSSHPALKEAAIKAVEKYGAGAGAARLVSGSLAPFHELEERLAAFKKTGAALTFSTGYAAAVGTITALVGKDDVIILDKLVHACIVDAAKLSGAKLRIFDHNDLADLEKILVWTDEKKRGKQGSTRTLIVTESIFSMDGDVAPLREIVALKEKYGAWLMVDEAHATGTIGRHGRGLADELGVSSKIEIQMGTLGKALGASGGYTCGSRALINYLINRARSFIFSTAPVPAAAAAALAAIELAQSSEGDELRKLLFVRLENLNSKLKIKNSKLSSAIVPLILGDEATALAVADKLRAQNIFVPAIRYPTVARGAARLRITLTAAHLDKDVNRLVSGLKSATDMGNDR
ncbi:MAG TPA: 8-amino-7-oxononanoate synthase [Candidatus Acidoferrales bacterium]|jgi:8-amino-7-oxononanoate synthase|nr:8-amino-7-oxononanoate synthase [Candidatus Acidoferrales bacterium]